LLKKNQEMCYLFNDSSVVVVQFSRKRKLVIFWATVCKMVSPTSYQSVVCLYSVLCPVWLWRWHIVAHRWYGSNWNLYCRQASAPATLLD